MIRFRSLLPRSLHVCMVQHYRETLTTYRSCNTARDIDSTWCEDDSKVNHVEIKFCPAEVQPCSALLTTIMHSFVVATDDHGRKIEHHFGADCSGHTYYEAMVYRVRPGEFSVFNSNMFYSTYYKPVPCSTSHGSIARALLSKGRYIIGWNDCNTASRRAYDIAVTEGCDRHSDATQSKEFNHIKVTFSKWPRSMGPRLSISSGEVLKRATNACAQSKTAAMLGDTWKGAGLFLFLFSSLAPLLWDLVPGCLSPRRG